MIIVDLNQVMISNLMMQINAGGRASFQAMKSGESMLTTGPDENMVRHMVLNSLRSYRQKFGAEYGEMIIACDNTNIWRKQFFPYYKANRKKAQNNSELDWNEIFRILNKIRSELKEYFPYRIIDIDAAEADDVIGTLVSHFGVEGPLCVGEKILILSGDKDFIQLHKFSNVKQYDPVHKKNIEHDNPEFFLKEHIIKGDASDGIPNILSSDNCFVIGERQKSLTKGRIEKLMNSDPSTYDTLTASRYDRNRTLIDLSKTPKEISDKIIESFNSQQNKDRSKLLKYFIENKLKYLMESISEF